MSDVAALKPFPGRPVAARLLARPCMPSVLAQERVGVLETSRLVLHEWVKRLVGSGRRV
ncbi:hypothetical protein [Thioalkalivibrio paradoxus]|uniref:Uncharacterized protein n=1 Tax=Thioalkalivibrio paradoxus ARh 1 TaxID=713585 RepID=W0DSP6_9GAMM|nr:hypothetical protein [Thioalkalivibrio paradoxus]AHF00009.1 hypothetical protein THITH_06365 [Thioalkalivibrio paradoxus ARh 1]